MQSFRTILPDFSTNISVLPDDRWLAMGSCFAVNIGERLAKAGCQTVLNPFGILYHPYPVADGLARLMGQALFDEKDIFSHQAQWYSFQHHGHFSDNDPQVALANMNRALVEGRVQLQTANHLILTFGTAFGFHEKTSDKVVSNCHKMPNELFERRLADLDQLKNRYAELFSKMALQFPSLNILLTVSPVRHIRDGLLANQRSKATLLLLTNWLETKFNNVHYFPTYELLMDDLRDYRFYANDLIHPSEMAIDYIWEFFVRNYFSEKGKTYLKAVVKWQKMKAHRALKPKSTAWQTFVERREAARLALIQTYPHLMDFL